MPQLSDARRPGRRPHLDPAESERTSREGAGTHGGRGLSDAPQTSRQTYPLPAGVGSQAFASMAVGYGLRVVELADTAITAITVEGRADALEAFADRLAQLRRLCR